LENTIVRCLEEILEEEGKEYEKVKCFRADQIAQLGFVTCRKICLKIQESDYIVADISEKNDNVFYEIGLSYGLRKKIIYIGRPVYEMSNHFDLVEDSDYFHYRNLNALTDTHNFKEKIRTARVIEQYDIEQKDSILIITDSSIENDFIYELQINRIYNLINRLKNEKATRLDWKVNVLDCSKANHDEIYKEIHANKIIVLDTTVKNQDKSNPFMYFCLGLAHGLGKDTIPMTHISEGEKDIPFDIRGLWHIFYNDFDNMVFQFEEIFLQIENEWLKEKKEKTRNEFWKKFIDDENVEIVAYARHWDRREGRHGIEGWDYRTVSMLSSTLSSIINDVKINTITPWCQNEEISNETINEEEVKKITQCLRGKVESLLSNNNAILIGSTELNEISEIVLSDVNKLLPFSKLNKKHNGFVFVKKTPDGKPVKSALFIETDKDGKVGINEMENGSKKIPIPYEHQEAVKIGTEYTSYGVLILVKNPYCDKDPKVTKRIAILSGFTGPCTYGIGKILADFNYTEELEEIYGKAKKFLDDPDDNSIIEALIKIKYKIGEPDACGDILKQGDRRDISKVKRQERYKISVEKVVVYKGL
jgi:hypothetical protein